MTVFALKYLSANNSSNFVSYLYRVASRRYEECHSRRRPMATLYVTEQSSIIRKTSDRLVIEKDDAVLAEIPCLKLDTVFLFGNVQVTTQALGEMLDHGIELALFTLSGKLRGQLTPPKAKNIPLRMKQYETSHSEDLCLRLAQEIVDAKIANSVEVLRRQRRNHPEVIALKEVQALDDLRARAEDTISIQELLGVEGTAASRYFRALAGAVPPEAGFSGRNRRPPRDPFNALLSFGYVLVGNEIQALLDGMGFDPYLGFYHQVDYGRPSLALDLLEELRAPLVDRFSLGLLKLGVLKLEDFTQTPERGVYLQREALRRYFREYEEELNRPFSDGDQEVSFRQIFRRQAERLARSLLEGEPYRSFRWQD